MCMGKSFSMHGMDLLDDARGRGETSESNSR